MFIAVLGGLPNRTLWFVYPAIFLLTLHWGGIVNSNGDGKSAAFVVLLFRTPETIVEITM